MIRKRKKVDQRIIKRNGPLSKYIGNLLQKETDAFMQKHPTYDLKALGLESPGEGHKILRSLNLDWFKEPTNGYRI